ncbi:hypothetical protein MICRO8M_80233 [Microbacterium sp. 8M]|nr:hypothetical protein MICRO8M_80233 [Microbacterium sp. 8M]
MPWISTFILRVAGAGGVRRPIVCMTRVQIANATQSSRSELTARPRYSLDGTRRVTP